MGKEIKLDGIIQGGGKRGAVGDPPAPRVPVNEHVYTTTDRPYTFRLNVAETEAFKAWCAARHLKHGPVIAAALREYMARHGEG